jgi:uncharacterized delta-60 repeat protein
MRRTSPLVLAALLIFSMGCDDESVGKNVYQPKIGEIIDVAGETRIDLPGRVSLLVQVLDERGEPFTGLEADNFRLYENDVEVSPSEAQQQLLPLPRVYQLLSMLLLDLSTSISQDPAALAAEIAAAKAYIEVVTRDPSQRIAISFFFGADDIEPAAIEDPFTGQFRPLGFSDDKVLLNEALDNVDRIEVFDDSTNLYGAVIQAVEALDDEEFDVLEEGEVEFVSKALVTFTDGGHNANDIPLEDAVAAIEGVAAFTIGVGEEIDRDALEALGPQGSVFVDDLSSLVDSFKKVAQALSDQANSFYRIAYLSPKNDGSRDPVLRVESANDEDVSLETTFSTRYFSSGAGFVNPITADPSLGVEGSCEDIAMGDAGDSYYLLRDPTGGGLAVGHALADGSLDPDFGIRGIAYLPASAVGSNFSIFAVALDASPVSDDVFVVAQRVSTVDFERNITVARIDEEGSFEVVNLPSGLSGDLALIDRGADIDVDGLGRIWIGGASSGFTGTRRLLLRLTSDMELDPLFGNGGVVSHVSVPEIPTDEITDVVLDGARALTVGAGFNSSRRGRDMQVVAFAENGSVDTTYGVDGIVDNWAVFESSALEGIGAGSAGLIDPADGDLVVAGSVSLRSESGQQLESAALWRLDSDGVPDPTFVGGFSNPFGPGTDFAAPGIVTLGDPLTGDPDVLFGRGSWFNAIVLRDDGNLLAAGGRDNAQSHFDALWLSTTPDGLIRAGYNGTGFFIDDGAVFDDGDEEIHAVAIQSGGPTLSCGGASTPGSLTGVPLLFRDEDTRRE